MKWLLVLLSLLCVIEGNTQSRRLLISPQRASGSSYNPATDANVVEWLKADALSLADNDPVGTWTASTGQDATRSGSLRPTFKTNIKNGLPIVRFDGVDDELVTSAFTTASQAFTVCLVFKYTGSLSTEGYIFTGATDVRLENAASTVWNVYANNGTAFISIGSSDANWHILMIEFNGASSKYRFDGGSDTTFSATPGGSAMSTLVLANLSGGTHGAFDLGEIFVRQGSFTDKPSVFSYLNSRWAVY